MDRRGTSARRTVPCCCPWLSARQDGGQPCTLRREARRQSTDQLPSASTLSGPYRRIDGLSGDLTRLLRHRLHLRAQLGTTSSVAARWCRAGDRPYAFISSSMLPLVENRGKLNFSTTRCCGHDAVACRTHGRSCSPRKGSPLRSDPASRALASTAAPRELARSYQEHVRRSSVSHEESLLKESSARAGRAEVLLNLCEPDRSSK